MGDDPVSDLHKRAGSGISQQSECHSWILEVV